MIHRLSFASSDEDAIVRRVLADEAFSQLWEIRERVVKVVNVDMTAEKAIKEIDEIMREHDLMEFYK